MSKRISVDDILNGVADEDLLNKDFNNVNIDDLLKEYGETSTASNNASRSGFRPNLEKRTMSQTIQDNDLEEILRSAENLYPAEELNRLKSEDYQMYLDNNNLVNTDQLVTQSKKPEVGESLPYKSRIRLY